MSVRLNLVTKENPKDSVQYSSERKRKKIVSEGYRLGRIESKRDDNKQIPKIEETD